MKRCISAHLWVAMSRVTLKSQAIYPIRINVWHGPGRATFYALCLDDDIEKEREIGIVAGLGMLWFCDELWVFGDEVTEGMHTEINFCKNLNIRIKKINEKDIRKVIGG